VKRIRYFILLLLLFSLPVCAAAPEPLDVVKDAVDRMIAVLNDPAYQPADKKQAQRDAMWKIVADIFDFEEISRRTLARNWRLFSAEQQQEFVHVFSRFLGNIYLDRIQEEYKHEKVSFKEQQMTADDKALVPTRIRRQDSTEIPVNYSMIRSDAGWRVYDVTIEGVSLVQNYRSQFNEFLLNKKPAQLIDRLKKKIGG